MAAAGAVPCPAGRLAVPAVLTRLLASALLIAATCALLAAAAVSTMLLAAVIVAALPLATSTCLGAVPFSATLTATLTATLAATLAITLAGLLLAPALPRLGCSLAAAAVCTPAVPVSGRECKLLRRPSGSTRITSHTSRSLIGTDMLVTSLAQACHLSAEQVANTARSFHTAPLACSISLLMWPTEPCQLSLSSARSTV